MEEPVITVSGLSKQYFIGNGSHHKGKHSLTDALLSPFRILQGLIPPLQTVNEKAFWALKDINFDVYHGEKIGIIGRNGAGKTTLLKILSRLVYPTEGEARIRGNVASLLGIGIGFKPDLTGRENIYLDASLHGFTRPEVDEIFNEIVEFSGVGKFIDTPVKYYSTGMHSRLAFAVAAHLDPDILMLDEVLAVGDMAFQQKCLKRVEGLASGGRTILFVSHGMGNIIKFCEKAIWLEGGRIVEFGDSRSVVNAYSRSVMKLKSTYHAKASQSQNNLSSKTEISHPDSPGAELISFEIFDAAGKTKEVFFRSEPIHIAVKYRVLREDLPLIAAIHLHKDGVHVFSSNPSETLNAPKFSVCYARTVIPSDMLNTGDYHFSVAIVTPKPPIMRHVTLDHVLSCKIVEDYNPQIIFSGEYKGVVRPKFSWECSVIKA